MFNIDAKQHVHKFDTVRTFQRPGEDKIRIGECSLCGSTANLDDLFTVVASTVVTVTA